MWVTSDLPRERELWLGYAVEDCTSHTVFLINLSFPWYWSITLSCRGVTFHHECPFSKYFSKKYCCWIFQSKLRADRCRRDEFVCKLRIMWPQGKILMTMTRANALVSAVSQECVARMVKHVQALKRPLKVWRFFLCTDCINRGSRLPEEYFFSWQFFASFRHRWTIPSQCHRLLPVIRVFVKVNAQFSRRLWDLPVIERIRACSVFFQSLVQRSSQSANLSSVRCWRLSDGPGMIFNWWVTADKS